MKINTEYATVIEWAPLWDAGASMPHVFSNGHKTYLVYMTSDPGQAYEESLVDADEYPESFALVEFDGHSFRFGIANDEVFNGLTLYEKGLRPYSAHLIHNSRWIDELKSIHKVHPRYDGKRWENRKHYMLLFHDDLLEVIATDYKVEVFKTSLASVVAEVGKRMTAFPYIV